MREMPGGHWVAFETAYDSGPHDCKRGPTKDSQSSRQPKREDRDLPFEVPNVELRGATGQHSSGGAPETRRLPALRSAKRNSYAWLWWLLAFLAFWMLFLR